jgi:hypothetical protein
MKINAKPVAKSKNGQRSKEITNGPATIGRRATNCKRMKPDK